MTTPARLLRATLLATIFATACDPGTDDDAPRLAVVLATDSGLEQDIGSYDAGSGELTLTRDVQVRLSDRFGDTDRRVIVAYDGEPAEIDLDAGVAVTTPDLEDGDVLELRVVGEGAGAGSPGRLELRAESDLQLREWKQGNISGMDDWERDIG